MSCGRELTADRAREGPGRVGGGERRLARQHSPCSLLLPVLIEQDLLSFPSDLSKLPEEGTLSASRGLQVSSVR